MWTTWTPLRLHCPFISLASQPVSIRSTKGLQKNHPFDHLKLVSALPKAEIKSELLTSCSIDQVNQVTMASMDLEEKVKFLLCILKNTNGAPNLQAVAVDRGEKQANMYVGLVLLHAEA